MYVTFMTFVKGFRGIITIKKDLQCRIEMHTHTDKR